MDVTFNARLQPATFTIPGKISKTYSYHADGALRFSSDALDHRFDRSYAYDHGARLKNALSGAEARGEGTTTNRPYYQTYGYDAFGHMSQRTVKTWWTGDATVSNTFVNNRQQGINWHHDADGRLVDGDDHYSYDAAGRNNYLEISGPTLPTATMTYDGDGRQVKTVETWVDETFETFSETKYYVRSTVLGGQVLTELDDGGGVWRTFVFAGPAILGWLWHSGGSVFMSWEQRDPSGATVRGIGEQELDPLGADAGTFATSVPPTEQAIVSYGSSYNPAHPNFSYSIDGIRVPVEDFVHLAGFDLQDPLTLLEFLAKKTPPALDPLDERRAIAGPSLESGGIPDLTLLPQTPVPTDELKRIRDDVEKSIAKCAVFLKALFDEAAIQTGQPYRDIMVTFDNIKFFYGIPGPGHGGEAYGSFEHGNATALIIEFKEDFVSTDRSAFIRTQTAQNFLGETIHHVGANGAYRDAALANALNTVLVRQGKDTPRQYFERTEAEINTASWYLHDRVFTACQMRYQ